MRSIATSPHLHLTSSELQEFTDLDYEDTNISYREYKNVVVLRSGMCLKRGMLIKKSIYDHPYLQRVFIKIAYGSWLTRRVARTDPTKAYVVVHNLWSGGYYHWITESLARLQPVMGFLDRATVLLPSNTKLDEVMVSSLKCFGVEDLEFFPPKANVFVRNLILPENPPRHLEVSSESVDFVRRHVLGSVGAGAKGKGALRRIFISRARSRGRKIVNEEEVAAFLADRGYERIFAEDLTFAEQVGLMQDTDVLVSQHGAGLTNLIFMRPGSKVLELLRTVPGNENWSRGRNTARLNPAYPRLAAKAGVHYRCLLCRATDLRQSFDVGDIMVDIPSLEEKLRAVETGP